MQEIQWRRATAVPLTVASVAFLVAYSWRVIAETPPHQGAVALAVMAASWALFIVDYVVRLMIAPRRWEWFRTHPADLAVTLLPVLRLVRLLRALTTIPGLRRTHGAALRVRIVVYGTGVTLVMIYLASLAVLDAEHAARGATITDFGDALWWSCVTATTTGYGDLVPVTLAGRLVGVVLMAGGVVLAGVITATVASWVLERGARGDDSQEPATRGQVRELSAAVDRLARRLGEPDGQAGPRR